MNTLPPTPSAPHKRSSVEDGARTVARLFGMAAIACVLGGGIAFEHSIADERADRRDEVGNEIANGIGDAQTVWGPLLFLEVSHHHQVVGDTVWVGGVAKVGPPQFVDVVERHVVAPEELRISARVDTETRHRGVFEIPVYLASSVASVMWRMPEEVLRPHKLTAQLLKDEAKLQTVRVLYSVSSAEGLVDLPKLRAAGVEKHLEPTSAPGLPDGAWMAASLPVEALASGTLTGDLQARMQGTRSVSWAPVAAMQTVDLSGNWPNPKYDGVKLPQRGEQNAQGFKATWSTVPASRQVSAHKLLKDDELFPVPRGEGASDMSRSFGVRFFQPVDIYALCVRATKYGMMFVLVTLGGLLLVEAVTKRRVSLGAHMLVGTSLSLFFVLLLAYAEHIGFGRAYMVAALACLLVNASFLGRVLRSKRIGLAFGATLSAVYGAMYVMLRSEDSALLMGSSLLFVLVSLAMFLVRNTMGAERSTLAEQTADVQ